MEFPTKSGQGLTVIPSVRTPPGRSTPAKHSQAASAARRINAICERFEQAWRKLMNRTAKGASLGLPSIVWLPIQAE
jgi:hypothetical protein